MLKEVKGDITQTDCELIVHGVNCQGVMGAGVAKALYSKWPEVRGRYLNFHEENKNSFPEDFLGVVDYIKVRPTLHVANCYIQQNYGPGNQTYLNYAALRKCLLDIFSTAVDSGIQDIAMPKIGCGLAGGHWPVVKKMIRSILMEDENYEKLKIKIYYL